MATDRQIEANRRNAQKCTGPKTSEGKSRSSQNAFKTGLHAKSEVLITESRDEYETLIAEYYERYQPAAPEERCLVDNLIQAEWLGRRYMAAASAIGEYDFRIGEQQDMGRTFVRQSEALSRAQRCITATQRSFAQTLKQLQALQARKQSQPIAGSDQPDAPPDTESSPGPQLVSFSPPDQPIAQPAAPEDPTEPILPPIAA